MKKVIIFDWAGTIIDKGSKAPYHAFVNTFKRHNLKYSDEEINRWMGLDKLTHLSKITNNQKLSSVLYPTLVCEMKDTVRQYSYPCPNVNTLFSYLRSKKYLIGSTSGYSRELLDIAINTASKNGMYIPFNVSSDEVTRGRPSNDMIVKNLHHFGLDLKDDDKFIIKVGDTVADIEEGNNANAILNIGISEDSVKTTRMLEAGATHVVRDVEELFTIL